ncbi:MAG: hypothetical protein U0Q15_03265 [Kineosporiaceae bacterium]
MVVQTRSQAADTAGPYGLTRPTLADVRSSLERVLPDPGEATAVVASLLQQAGVRETDAGEQAFTAVLETMRNGTDPILALCARSLQIRRTTFEQLTAVHDIVQERTP